MRIHIEKMDVIIDMRSLVLHFAIEIEWKRSYHTCIRCRGDTEPQQAGADSASGHHHHQWTRFDECGKHPLSCSNQLDFKKK
jgi:hypothetical protein